MASVAGSPAAKVAGVTHLGLLCEPIPSHCRIIHLASLARAGVVVGFVSIAYPIATHKHHLIIAGFFGT